MSENREIVLFQNIRQVIKAEQWCRENSLSVKVIPVPKPWSSECGMCLETTKETADKLEEFAIEQGMITQRITTPNNTD
jgi:hypothetical protein